MGGCLLMFAQLPIFIGLYRCLATDIDLREAALIPGIQWASNLAGPDELFRWKQYLWRDLGDEAHGWLGPYCNILPLITIALFMVQQKLFTPPALNEEQKMQQKIMNFMTIFMGVMFYKVPAGLCIYFITSSLWGILERKFITKPNPGAAASVAVPEKPDAGGGAAATKKPAAAPSFVEKLLGMADAQLQESKSVSPRKKAKK
jgi:YidC/Oxa1 family membrane protein insertase